MRLIIRKIERQIFINLLKKSQSGIPIVSPPLVEIINTYVPPAGIDDSASTAALLKSRPSLLLADEMDKLTLLNQFISYVFLVAQENMMH